MGAVIKGSRCEWASALQTLAQKQIVVGIPGGMNAQLLYIHSKGSPKKGIPARPAVEPAIEQAGGEIAEIMAAAVIAALDGDMGGALSQLEAAGEHGEAAVKAYFSGGNGWAANKLSTLKYKSGSAPLIDTGAMRAAITHEVR